MKPRFQGRVALLGLAMFLWLSPASYAALYQVQEDYSWFERNVTLPQLNQEPEATHGSGPVAAIISFMYLQHRYPEVYQEQLVIHPIADTILLASSTYMNTGIWGTWVRDFVWGANLFTDARVPGTTVYLGQAVPQGNQSPGGWTAERYKPSWLTEGNPTWWFIFEQLCQGKNVEISLGSGSAEPYFLTATGMSFDDLDNNGVMASEEQAVLYYIDPASGLSGSAYIWQTGAGELLQTDFAPGCCITMAVAEGPVPLPSTLLLVGSGGLGLLAFRRRSRKLH
ncbi:MAG: PEP-CTERM sorting domain-containing protein [Syntrophobacterales bacterium]|jgi:hypothetical protein|nr:PEP-CTERM sorting domain-containing protein [Syntrophobacterales bacterium]